MLLKDFLFEAGHQLIDGDQLSKAVLEPAYSVDNAVTATGTGQADAYPIAATVTIVTGGMNGAGVRLPAPKVGRVLYVLNYADSGKVVWASDEETINGDESVVVAFGVGLVLVCIGASAWAAFQILTTGSGAVVLDVPVLMGMGMGVFGAEPPKKPPVVNGLASLVAALASYGLVVNGLEKETEE